MDIQKFGSYFFSFLIIVNLFGIFYSSGEEIADTMKDSICEIVNIVELVLGAVMLILIVLAAIIYAAGQVLGAETRARANVWATSMFVGAIIGGLIYILIPGFVGILSNVEVNSICTPRGFSSS